MKSKRISIRPREKPSVWHLENLSKDPPKIVAREGYKLAKCGVLFRPKDRYVKMSNCPDCWATGKSAMLTHKEWNYKSNGSWSATIQKLPTWVSKPKIKRIMERNYPILVEE